MMIKKLKIRGKLVLSFSLVLVLVLSALGIITYFTFAESLIKTNQQVVSLNAKLGQQIVENTLNDYSCQLRTFSDWFNYTRSQNLNKVVLQKQLKKFQQRHQAFTSLTIFNPDGKVLTQVGDSFQPPENLLKSSVFNMPNYVDSNGITTIADTNFVGLIAPLSLGKSKDSSVIVMAQLPISVLKNLFEHFELPEKASLIIANARDHVLVLHQNDNKPAPASPSQILNWLTVSRNSKTFVKHEDYYLYRLPFKQVDWNMLYVGPENVFLADVIHLKNRVIAATIIVLWISIWIVLIVAHQISKPIRQLSKATMDIHQSDYSKPLEVEMTGDEISELAHALESMRQHIKMLIFTDPLTGLYNRRYMMFAMSQEVSRTSHSENLLICLLMDLDYFKHVNDNFGHLCGNKILKITGEILKDTLRDYDIVARYGGEEFIAIFSSTNLQQAYLIAERTRKSIENHIIGWEQQELRITMSMGLAEWSKVQTEYSTEQLIHDADQALYEAKYQGRNRVIHNRRENGFYLVAEPIRPATSVSMQLNLSQIKSS